VEIARFNEYIVFALFVEMGGGGLMMGGGSLVVIGG